MPVGRSVPVLLLLTLTFSVSADAPAKVGDLSVDDRIRGTLDAKGEVFEERGPFHVYGFTARENGEHTVDLESYDFDGFVRITSSRGRLLGENDDGGLEVNARARFRAVAGREYRVIVVANRPGSGEYFVTVRAGREPRLSGEALRSAAIEYRQIAARRALERGDGAAAVKHQLLSGKLYSAAGYYDRAVEVFEGALKIAEEIESVKAQVLALRGLGFVDIGLEEGERARRRFLAMLKLTRKSRDSIEEAKALRGVVISSLMLKQPDEALKYQIQHLELARAGKKFHDVGESLLSLAGIHRRLGNYDEAREVLEESMGLLEQVGDTDAAIRVLEQRGLVEQAAGDIDAARRHLDDALKRAEKLGIESILVRVRSRRAELDEPPEPDGEPRR